jgi:hypothetical protein
MIRRNFLATAAIAALAGLVVSGAGVPFVGEVLLAIAVVLLVAEIGPGLRKRRA